MLLRIIVLTSLLALPAATQDTPVKPKVVATPKPKPRPKTPAKPAKPADPLASYIPGVKAAFAARWVDAVTPRLKDFDPGAINITFKLDADAKVVDFKVVENTSNEAFAKFCEEFVRETVFELPPEKVLTEGAVEIPFTFKII
jgi:outer membrane biosynthesis protein TonB